MKLISFGDGYINCSLIESIQTRTSSTMREVVVTMASGDKITESSNSNLSRALLDKVLDSSGGFTSK